MNPIAMVQVGVAWPDHTWQIMQVYISACTPENEVTQRALDTAQRATKDQAANLWIVGYDPRAFAWGR